jgi:hypothetical protein
VVLLSGERLIWVILADLVDLDTYRNGGTLVLDVVTPANCGVKAPRKKLHQVVRGIDPDQGLRERIMSLLPRLWRTFTSTSSDTPERTVARLLCRYHVRSEPELLNVNITSFTGGYVRTHNT